MDFLDYREKLGIGCYDGEKFTFFPHQNIQLLKRHFRRDTLRMCYK